MSHTVNKVQAYIDANTKQYLLKKSEEKAVSLSRYASQILAEHARNVAAEKAFKARVIAILGHILSCVYDKESLNDNMDLTQEILDSIKK